MLFRSISILLLLSLTAFGQAFTPRRPFILQSVVTNVTPPWTNPMSIPGLAYWWVASDLTNTFSNGQSVTNWLDRIQSYSLSGTTNLPTLYTNSMAVQFSGSNWLRLSPSYLPFSAADTNTSNMALGLIAYGQDGCFLANTNKLAGNWAILGFNFTPKIVWGAGDLGPISTNKVFDLLYTPNYIGAFGLVFTNGVYTGQGANQYTSGFDGIGARTATTPPIGGLTGRIYEIQLWTNQYGVSWTASWVSNLNYYATNTYPTP